MDRNEKIIFGIIVLALLLWLTLIGFSGNIARFDRIREQLRAEHIHS